jgi:hypothetical protein
MKRILFLSVIYLLFSNLVLSQNSNLSAGLNETVLVLSADSLEGRLTGSIGEKKAANYLVNQLKSIGVSPFEKQFIFPFSYVYKSNPHDTSSVSSVDITGMNVVGFLDNGREQTIVLGAHYDHLGRNEHHNSTDINSFGEIHNGADDNASGVAAALEVARELVENDVTESSNFIFAFFSGEEDGLVGSKAFLEDNVFQSLKINCMLNLDMVGRLDSLNKLHVGGFGTSPVFPPTLSTNNLFNLSLAIDSSGVGPSDHTSFYLKNIPVLFFYTGTHDDYHKPSDDVEKVNFVGLEIITNYVYSIALSLSSEESIPFTPSRTILKSKSRGKISLGIMPNYISSSKGLQVDGVSKGKPAEKGGILAGDIITRINDCEISDVYAYMDCLSLLNLGDKLNVTVIRNGKKVKCKVQL